MTNGWNTKELREKHHLEKDRDVDAYCIACSHLKPEETLVETEPFEILQFRKHNRAIIHHQTERTYKLDGVTVAKKP